MSRTWPSPMVARLLPALLLATVAAAGHKNLEQLAAGTKAQVQFFVRDEPSASTSAASALSSPRVGLDPSNSFQNIASAVAAVRALPKDQRCGATVTIAGGVYTGEANAFRLTEEDSGCAGDPVVYRADPDDPKPVLLSGGAQIEPSAFKISGQTSGGLPIWEADLQGLGDLAATNGQFHTGWVCANGNRTELFFGGNAMVLARHPNKKGDGTWQYLRQGESLGSTKFVAGTDDTAAGANISTDAAWLQRLGSEGSAWVHGFFSWDWADSFAPVKAVHNDPSSHEVIVNLDLAPAYGLKPGSRYLFLNSRSLLDAPSEYYIDARASKLYFIPPVGTNPSKPPATPKDGAFLSQQQYAHTVNGTSHVSLRDLRLEHAVGSSLWIGGDSTGVTVDNCTLANSGMHGVELTGSHSAVTNSDIYDVGCDGVSVSGGDTIKLVSSNLSVHKNTIHAFARVSRTIRPGVAWGGCGITVSGNEIYNAPHSGIMIAPASDGRGTNCTFEDNDLHDLCQGTADAGGFYAGRTWANRGNIVRRNKFRRFYQTEKMAQSTSVNGIYLDDMESGWRVEDNYFESTTRCMFIGGGRQNIVRNNTFVNCTTPVHIDSRGLGWMKCGVGQIYPSKFIDELEQIFHYRTPPWSDAFPNIDTALDPCAPALNTVQDNRFCTPGSANSMSAVSAAIDDANCATCPASFKYPYTPSPSSSPEGSVTGSYCCTVPAVSNACPSAHICCLTPGSQKITRWSSHGCEGIARCGNNPTNKTACKPPTPPAPPGLPPGFSDFEQTGAKPEWRNVFNNNTAFHQCPPTNTGPAASLPTVTIVSAGTKASGGLRYSFWVEGPVSGGCPGWGMPYPGFSAAAKQQSSCWNNTLRLVAKHAGLIDELDLSVGFAITNTSKGLFDLDMDGSAWAPGYRLRPLDWLPHWLPDIRKTIEPDTTIVVPFGFSNNATQVAQEAYANAESLAEQMVKLATQYDWIDGFVLDYEADCGDCVACPSCPGGVQNATLCIETRKSCVPQEAQKLTSYFKTLSAALHSKGKTLGFCTNKNGAGFEHWPYYEQYIAAGVDRLYEMGTYLNHSHDGQAGDRENVTQQLLQYPLEHTAFGLGDYGIYDTAEETRAWLTELQTLSANMTGQLQVHVYDLYGARPSNESCVNRTVLDPYCARPPPGWWPVLQQFHNDAPSNLTLN